MEKHTVLLDNFQFFRIKNPVFQMTGFLYVAHQ